MPETTQSDLVERLTKMADLYRRAISDDNEDAQTFAEAATEIARLRAHCEAMAKAIEHCQRGALSLPRFAHDEMGEALAAYRKEGGA